uniref:Torsin-1A-interacting protein 1-like n=1 Tax=Petromyzon marinus TaxID=7757 RepID=A0AAJ7UJ10_PETMA|nr:torsin-1A-interacting protein 1-like [Petromyzon marinus]
MAATTPPRTRGAASKDAYLESLTGVTSRRGIRQGVAGDKSPSRHRTKVKPPREDISQGGEEVDEEGEEEEMDGGSLENSDDELPTPTGPAPSGWANASEMEHGDGDKLEAGEESETDAWQQYTKADTGKGSDYNGTLSEDERSVESTELDGGRMRQRKQQQQQQQRQRRRRQQQQQQRKRDGCHSYRDRRDVPAAGRRPSAAKEAASGGRDRPPRPPRPPLLLAGVTLAALAVLAAAAWWWWWSAGAGRGRGSPGAAGRPGAPEPPHSAVFGERLEAARRRHPSQCDELWRRVNITLRRHLAALADGDPGTPSQPATLLLASGPRGLRAAEGLAAGLAAAYGDAAAAAAAAKLALDERLRSALGAGGAGVALVRLERLPPASTLMLYAYCDHETAKFKRALIVFTVLLDAGGGGGGGVDAGGGDASGAGEAGEGSCRALRDFTDRVYASLRRALVGPRLDLDKFAGLWSRVATVVLPVQPEGSP